MPGRDPSGRFLPRNPPQRSAERQHLDALIERRDQLLAHAARLSDARERVNLRELEASRAQAAAALRKAEEQAPQQRAQRGVADRPARRDVVAAPSRSPPSCRRSASQTEHAELQPDLFQLVVEHDPRGARFVICRLLLREPGGGIGNG